MFECADLGVSACGNAANHTGYACQMVNLVKQWRKAWSVLPGTTDPVFPLGVVTLAPGEDEGYAQYMAAMRLAQTGSYGTLPSPDLPRTFLAHALDAGDPWLPGDLSQTGATSRVEQVDVAFQASFDHRPFDKAGGVQSTTPYYLGP